MPTRQKIKILLLSIFIPIIIYSSQGNEQLFNLNEDIYYKYLQLQINLQKLRVTDNYYFLSVIFINKDPSDEKLKILFNIKINGTENSNDFICTNIYSGVQVYRNRISSWKKNNLFSNFYREPFVLLTSGANSDKNIEVHAMSFF